MNNSKLVRGALLVALALALQSLRLVLPMPQMLSTFIIGTLVHMMLVLALQLNGLKTALLLAAWAALSFLALPNPALRKTVMFAMSVPQLLTAVAGILLAEQVKKRLRQVD